MTRRYIRKQEKATIAQRASFRCEYCLIPDTYSMQAFVNEHINPVSKGGVTELINLAYACGGCNGHKHEQTEVEDIEIGESVPLFNPRKQKWKDHFEWSEDKVQIIGLTAVGRVTVSTLKMNRVGLVNLRKLLLTINEHPPKLSE